VEPSNITRYITHHSTPAYSANKYTLTMAKNNMASTLTDNNSPPFKTRRCTADDTVDHGFAAGLLELG
jgi:hypothetical protein